MFSYESDANEPETDDVNENDAFLIRSPILICGIDKTDADSNNTFFVLAKLVGPYDLNGSSL